MNIILYILQSIPDDWLLLTLDRLLENYVSVSLPTLDSTSEIQTKL